MADRYNRWCVFFDLELRSSPREGPIYDLAQLVAPLRARIAAGESRKVIDRERRVLRILASDEMQIDGRPVLAMVFTLGNATAADPSFMDFVSGEGRDPERREGEVPAYSAHCLLRLDTAPELPGRYTMMLEQSQGLGRTAVERLLTSEFQQIAESRGDNFTSRSTGRPTGVRPIVELYGHKSQQMEDALNSGTFQPIEFIDTTPEPNFDEPGRFRTKRRVMKVDLLAPPGQRREALEMLSSRAREAGYQRMRISWRPQGATRPNDSEVETDLADLGQALFTKRELIHVEAGMAVCSHSLRPDFVAKMAERFGT
jgi:hypothetical protein